MAKSPINSAGSNSGRGFRYQDAVAALLAVRGWAGVSAYGQVTPEANDDCDLASGDATVFAQIKSRRSEVGLFALASVATYVLELWDRHDAASTAPDALWLILERPFKGGPPLTTLDALPGILLAVPKLRDDPRFEALATKTKIAVIPTPMDEAIALIAETLPCLPAEGSIHYASVLHEVGQLSDENGVARDGAYASIAKTDVAALIDAVRGLIALDDMDAALRDGLVEAIDFLTPIDDPDFYLGVDVEPGHLAAGLVAERPDTRAEVATALERRGQALVTGTSGAGKSALMWDAASAVRHVVRWYRVRSATAGHAPVLARFARALRATPSSPVGFVFDDVGGDLRGAWDAFSRLTPAASGVVMLGSIRAEDLFLIETRARTAEIQVGADDALAERLWTELRDRGATEWAGWREPWSMAGGLMLEFAHILTQGERMVAVLADQVDRRQREGRDLELAILRITSLAGSASAVVETAKLASGLGVSEADIARDLRRLVDEHLVREASPGMIGGLHQLRSKHLLMLTHRTPPPTLARTIADAVPTVPASHLEALVANADLDDEDVVALVDALAARLEREPDPALAAAAFRGLGERHIHATLKAWIPTVLARGIVPTLVSTAVMFAIADIDLIDLPQMEQLNAATLDLRAARAEDPRVQLIARLSVATQAALVGSDLEPLEVVLASLVGTDAAPLIDVLRTRTIDLSEVEMALAVRLLGTVALHDRDLAQTIVTTSGREGMLARLHAETPWTTPFAIRDEADGRIVAGDVILAAPSVQTDVHAEVVAVVEKLIALVPDADFAAVSAMAPDGLPAGLPDHPTATKRMGRAAALADALPRWNRRWMSATSAILGAKSYTEFLERGFAGLAIVVPALETVVDGFLRGKANQPAIDQLGKAFEIAQHLTSPAGSVAISGTPASGSGAYVSDLQSTIHDVATDLPRKIINLPDGHGAFQLWTNGLLDRIEKARSEPWTLIDKVPDALFDRLRDAILALQVIAGEAARRNGKPTALWATVARAARKGNALRVVGIQASAGRARQLDALKSEVTARLEALGLEGEVVVRAERDVSIAWPYASVLIVIDVENQADFISLVLEHWEALRAVAGDGRPLTLVPRVHGLIVSRRTIGGYDTALPRPGTADEQLREAGFNLLDEVQILRLGALFDAMYEVDAIRQYGYGEQGRPAVERATLDAAIAARAQSLESLSVSARDEVPDFPNSLAEFVRMSDAGEIDFAADLAATTHGERSNTTEQMERLQAIMLTLDLIAHIQRRDGDDDTSPSEDV